MGKAKIYKEACMRNITFTTPRGEMQVQDLFQLPMTGTVSLDSISIELQKLKDDVEKSLVKKSLPPGTNLRLSIVADVIETRLKLADKAKVDAERIKRRQDLHKALEVKRVDELSEMSIEEIEAELKK